MLKRIFLELADSVRDTIQLQFQNTQLSTAPHNSEMIRGQQKPTSTFAFALHIAVVYHADADGVEKQQLKWIWETPSGNLKDGGTIKLTNGCKNLNSIVER